MATANRRTAIAAGIFMACAGMALTSGAHAQAQSEHFPSKPITIMVPFPAGNSTDAQMRILALHVGDKLGQPVIVMNMPGVGGTLAPSSMARSAKPDGYTLSTVAGSVFRLPYLQKMNYDPATDFTYVIGLSNYNFGIAVRADAPWKNLAELIDAAKKTPDQITWAGIGQNSAGNIALIQLSRKAGFALNYVPYKGAAPAITDLLGGHVSAIGEAGWGPMVESGKMRLLALMGHKSSQYPGIPTLKELGYDIHADAPLGLVGPKGMEPRVVKILHDAFLEASKLPQYQEILRLNSQPYDYMSTSQYQQWATKQIATEKRQIAELGLKAE